MLNQKLKMVLLFAILIFSLFTITINKSEAQPPCPSGFTSGVFTTFVDGCWYQITICFKCSSVSNIPSELMLYSYRPINPNCIQTKTDEEIMATLKQKAVTHFLSTCVPQPCGETPIFYFVENEYACWKRTGSNNEIVEPCSSSAICQTLKSVCIENGTPITTTYYSEWQYSSEPNCGSIVTKIESDGNCYHIRTNCD